MILLDSLVNVSPVSDVVQVNPALAQIEFVNDSVIAYAQFEFIVASRLTPATLAALPCMSLASLAPLRTAFESLVWESFQSRAHFVHLALNSFADRTRQ